MTSIQMPQLGETIIEGTILKWLKQEGEHVDADEPLFEISTDKVDTEVPSPVSGVLTKILVAEGATVAVKTTIAEIQEDGAELGDGAVAAPVSTAAVPVEMPTAAPAETAASSTPPAGGAALTPAASLPDRGPRSQILSPLVRRLAAENGVDLARVAGTGTGGRITKTDVMAAISPDFRVPVSGHPSAAPEIAPAPAPAPPTP